MTDNKLDEYSRSLRIPVYDVGPKNLLKFGSALRLVQETSEQHLNVLHIGYEAYRAEGFVFFIISTRVKLLRLPEHGEPVTVKTHPRGRGGAQFYRDFKFYDADRNLIIDVMQTTVLADAETHKVQLPQNLYKYGVFKDYPVEKEERISRIGVNRELPFAGERQVYYSDLDANGHVNNSVYGDIFVDFLPGGVKEESLKEVCITYINETEPGDKLKIYSEEKNGRVSMYGVNKNGNSFAATAVI